MTTPPDVLLYDTTLRDGLGMEGIVALRRGQADASCSKLDELGVHYIEGGYPGSNPKDAEFFERARDAQAAARAARRLRLDAPRRRRRRDGRRAARRAATPRRPSSRSSASRPPSQVRDVLETTEEENLAMIADSVRFLSDAAAARSSSTPSTSSTASSPTPTTRSPRLRAAAEAGAEPVALCDTNGGTMPDAHRARRGRGRRGGAVRGGHPLPQRRRAGGREHAARRCRRA